MKKGGASVLNILEKLCQNYRWKFQIDTYRCAGYVEFPSGKSSFFWKNNFDLNPHGSIAFIEDKGYTRDYLSSQGYPIAPGYTCYHDSDIEFRIQFNEWKEYARKLEYPIIIKPNDESLGTGIRKVLDQSELEKAIQEVISFGKVFIIEKYIPGEVWRLLMSREKCISFYQTISARITGDGIHDIEILIHELIEKHPKIQSVDPRFLENIEREGYTLKSILQEGEVLELLDISNFSAGGTMLFSSTPIHPEIEGMMCEIMQKMNLEWCGIDIIATNIALPIENQDSFVILELNGKPGIHGIPEEQVFPTLEKLFLQLSDR